MDVAGYLQVMQLNVILLEVGGGITDLIEEF